MVSRIKNTKTSVTQASAWVTYLLIGIGIFSPVFCVIWLVQKTVESENALVQQLVENAQAQSFADTADLVRLTAQGMVPSPKNGGVRYSWAQSPQIVFREDAAAGKAKLAEIRERVSKLSNAEAQLELAKLISAPELDSFRLLGGRRLELVLVEMGMARVTAGERPEENFSNAVERLLVEDMSSGPPSRQLRYTLRRYASLSDSPEIERLAETERLVERWLAHIKAVGWPPADGLGSGDGFFYQVDLENSEVAIFPYEALLAASENLEALRNERFSLELNEGEDAAAYRLKAPLDFLYLVPNVGTDFRNTANGKAMLYIWIGGIVLGLSVLSGAAIVVSVRRQASVTQLKDNLVATVTHELKTPVSSIRLLVDTLMDEERREKVNTQEYIELISRENQRLGRLIDNFLSFSRMERSKGSFDISPIAPEDVVESAEQAFRERFQGEKFTLSVETDNNLLSIMGDPDALSTVLGNLLENAFKYGGQEKGIFLKVRNVTGGVEFAVQDSGQGIAKRDQKRIFRKFFQIDEGFGARFGSVGDRSGSVGLGLSIVDFIVSKHSGKIMLESELGEGSTFRVRIPYA